MFILVCSLIVESFVVGRLFVNKIYSLNKHSGYAAKYQIKFVFVFLVGLLNADEFNFDIATNENNMNFI